MQSTRMSEPIPYASHTDGFYSGSIETPLMDKRNALEGVIPGERHPTPIDRLGTAEDVANLIVFLLSDESLFISGASYAVDGAWAC